MKSDQLVTTDAWTNVTGLVTAFSFVKLQNKSGNVALVAIDGASEPNNDEYGMYLFPRETFDLTIDSASGAEIYVRGVDGDCLISVRGNS